MKKDFEERLDDLSRRIHQRIIANDRAEAARLQAERARREQCSVMDRVMGLAAVSGGVTRTPLALTASVFGDPATPPRAAGALRRAPTPPKPAKPKTPRVEASRSATAREMDARMGITPVGITVRRSATALTFSLVGDGGE